MLKNQENNGMEEIVLETPTSVREEACLVGSCIEGHWC